MTTEDSTSAGPPPDDGSDGRGRDEAHDPQDRCSVCGGSRVITVDAFTPSRGHFTYEVECDACERDRDFDERDDDDRLGPLEKWWP